MDLDEEQIMAARDRLAQLQREAEAAAADSAQLADRLASRSYRAWSRGRDVQVTVGADGLVQGVEFTGDAMTLSPRMLAAATLDAHEKALVVLRESVEEEVAQAPDSFSGLRGAILADLHRVIPVDDDLPGTRR
ncbi:YbaB/EbfC family nucleoid-associated protein [Microbacterium sp. ARD32]|uniref:YbaB/EbfC family nucleoid-associated protein n=1 Tax=Microbacterium sp. ARD32 TaxID=2962577 RepID=UPI002882888F|nr:YbaB/EbfC family nucleoid-associated protein [Microbacterium sp. ARD32]MDT0156252.1 YbaB/EbfC family nucleoid-associated protein [Microbacterium sp. ARD32]